MLTCLFDRLARRILGTFDYRLTGEGHKFLGTIALKEAERLQVVSGGQMRSRGIAFV